MERSKPRARLGMARRLGGAHRAASSGTPVSRVRLLPPDPGLEGLPLEDEHRRGPARGCWGAYADAQAPWRPRGVKDPRLPDPRGVNGVLDEAPKAHVCALALSLIR